MPKCFIAAFAALFACCACFSVEARAADEQIVVVTGIGVNEDAANRQAYRNAVQQVVGAMVVSETFIENNELIRDAVVSHSDGYVTAVKQLGAARSIGDGLVEVTVAATVAMGDLRKKLEAENIAVTEMDGQSLFAEIVTSQDKEAGLRDVVTAAMKDGVASVIKAEAGKPRNGKKAGQVIVPVTLSIDDAAYVAFCRNVEKTLEDAGVKVIEKSVEMEVWDKNGRDPFGRQNLQNCVLQVAVDSRKPEDYYLICIVKKMAPEAKSARIKQYSVSKDVMEGLAETLKWYSVKITIQDANGESIASETIPVDYTEYGRHKYDFGKYEGAGSSENNHIDFVPVLGYDPVDAGKETGIIFVITPRLDATFWGGFTRGNPTIGTTEGNRIVRDVMFTLDESELKQARSIQCTVFAEEQSR